MRIDVFTIFPSLVDGFCSESLLGRARNEGLVSVNCHDLREHTSDVHHSVDDAPFGGGAGMVMTPQPIFDSFERSGALVPSVFVVSHDSGVVTIDPPEGLFELGDD